MVWALPGTRALLPAEVVPGCRKDAKKEMPSLGTVFDTWRIACKPHNTRFRQYSVYLRVGSLARSCAGFSEVELENDNVRCDDSFPSLEELSLGSSSLQEV